jgi:hypothetical protein
MANCHFDQESRAVPVCVLTDIKTEKILINNSYPADNSIGSWSVIGSRIMVTRFWATSSATVMLSPNLPIGNAIPQALPPEINLEREFCIWLGYIESPRPVTLDDLKNNYLLRVYTGIIENIKDTASSSAGYSIMLQSRDRVKWLLDSSIYFSAQELITAGTLGRAGLILEIANYAIGGNSKDPETSLTGKSFLKDENYYNDVPNAYDPTPSTPLPGANEWYKQDQPLSGKTKMDGYEINENPYLRIISTRQPMIYEENKEAINFLLAGQMPLETLKSLSFQEIYPFEVFQDQRDGNLYYAPRGNDSSGLSDPERFYRRYFFKVEEEMNINKKLIALRTENSSIGLKTNFLISKQAPDENRQYDDYIIHLMTKPPILKDIDYAAKFHKVYDPTIKNGTDALLVGLALARIWSKEVQAGLAIMIGDPSVTPGEIVQVYGSPLTAHLAKDGREEFLDQEKDSFISYNDAWDKQLVEYADLSKAAQATESRDIPQNIPIGPNETFEGGGATTDQTGLNDLLTENYISKYSFRDTLKTVYRIEAIIHKYNLGNKGYTTELALVAPF